MRRHDRPFSHDVDDDRDITQQFWGTSPGWTDQSVQPDPTDRRRPSVRPRALRRDDTTPASRPAASHRPESHTTGAIRAIRDGLVAFRPQTSIDASGPIDRTRSHGIVRPHVAEQPGMERVDAPVDDPDWGTEVALSDEDAFWHDAPAPRRAPVAAAPWGDRISLAAVDPLLLRVGIFVLALVVLFPLAWAMRSDDAGTITTGTPAEPADSAATPPPATAAPPTGSATDPAAAPAAGNAPLSATPAPADATRSAAGSTGDAPTAGGDTANATTGGATSSHTGRASNPSSASDGMHTSAEEPPPSDTEPDAESSGIGDEPATVDALAERVEPDCTQTYLAQPGDSWYSIAEAAGITPTALISSNQATLDTVILPGDEICLPEGATVPPQTTTTTSTTTTSTTVPDTTPPTSEAPATTPAEVQQLIRDIWPDDLEDKALEVAYRESRYQHDAYNGTCCYGVFQIYWSVHRGWLDDYDIHRAEDLFDARKNIEAAYALYRAAGGWDPWSQTAY